MSIAIVIGGFILFILVLRKTGRAKRRHDSRLGRDLEFRPLAAIPQFTKDELREMRRERKRA